MIEIPMTFYHDSSEQLRGVLGQNYISTIISEKKVERSLMVLTNKRLYATGKIYEMSNAGFVSTQGKKAVSVKDITGTAFREINVVSMLVIGWILVGIGLLALFACSPSGRSKEEEMRILAGLGLVLGGAFCIFIYYMTRKRWFIIEYAGGAIATKCKWYSPSEIEDFQRKISLEKDRIDEETQGRQS